MNPIDYNEEHNTHTIEGPVIALSRLLEGYKVSSLLDVGCGPGNWTRAAMGAGVSDVVAMDGIAPSPDLPAPATFIQKDFNTEWHLNRRFDLAICLEVAEHLSPSSASVLVNSICAHANLVIFSAAIPGQPGQHHINCQWPEYWQQLFNDCGYICSDDARWDLWDIDLVEPWYRQNIFIACRSPQEAGKEPRLCRVIHPEMLQYQIPSIIRESRDTQINEIQKGHMPMRWYLNILFRALLAKIKLRLK